MSAEGNLGVQFIPGGMRRHEGPIQRLSTNARNIKVQVDGQYAGHIFWHPETGEVEDIRVNPQHQRKGIGSALYMKARELDPNVGGSDEKTRAGKALEASLRRRLSQ